MPERPFSPATGLQPVETPDWYDQRHHNANGGFQNIWGNDHGAPFFKTVGWLLGHGVSRGKQSPPITRLVDPVQLRTETPGIRITWLGHSTTYVQMAGKKILIDPMFSERASPVRFAGPRRIPPLPMQVEDLPGVDLVLISHDHYDHLDASTIRSIQELFAPVFLMPLDVGDILAKWGVERVRELDWWQSIVVDSLRFTCTPAQHFSGRGITNRNGTLWAGWYVTGTAESTRLFYAGDTGYATHFREIRERLGAPEVALLPVGAYLPRWFMQAVHVDPAEAVQAFLELEAAHLIPVHWGTFKLADDPISEGPRLVREIARAKGIADRVHVLEIGESMVAR